jgi:FAD/FMN-containing dehydrogenase
VIELSRLKGVRVNREARTAQVEEGCAWGDLDHAAHAFGLATPGGILSTSGAGGLTTGGGFGYLSRKYGLARDNPISADVVTADGQLRDQAVIST